MVLSRSFAATATGRALLGAAVILSLSLWACGSSNKDDAGAPDASVDGGPLDAAAPDALGVGTDCDPLMDRCAQDLTCAPAGANTTRCNNAGPTARGADCTRDACQKGNVCLNVSSTGAICYQPCNSTMGMGRCDATGAVCVPLSNFRFGVCKVPTRECDPLSDRCAGGRACQFNPPDLVCGMPGQTAMGGDCSMERCQRGLICLSLMGRPGPQCFQPCDPASPACTGGAGFQCATFGEAFGICVSM